ncbi:MAG: 16S rRNA (uracil(1498)-N(3))-methyltransferase [Gammaproteobacteria bacterium]|nr:16S rRNA (uracil(1498)-N(3))-methyltransferase [Gammaproteobacteria bacterium]MBU1415168.1 16S rRNA (uracil(1498)-N(3))-methyltransferase [Gammaproteobacteria bacterium]
MIPRFHCPFPLAPGAHVDLPPEAAHHAIKVLRMDDGDAVALFDGRGGEWTGRLRRAGKTVTVALESFDDNDREPPLSITLAQGLPAADKMDWIMQKAVELGVAAIRPVACRRSVIRLSGERMERRVAHWQAVAVAACEQCRRNRVPEVAPLLDLPQFLGGSAGDNGLRLILEPEAGQRLAELPKPTGPVTLLIGPEGGFEDGELAAAASVGFQAVSLGPRVLRTETAGIAAIAAMMALWGDF